MASQNKTKLLAGFILIIVAFIWLAGAFYYSTKNNLAGKDKLTLMEAEISKLKKQSQNSSLNPAAAQESPAQFKLETLVKKAENIYPETEKSRTEGFLWFDRASQSFIITLGALQGLHPGSQLSIYEGDKKIDMASVDFPFDVVSYVKPIKNSPDAFTSNYYRVVLEAH